MCQCGELIRPSKGVCDKCGGRPVSMDGYSNRQLAMMDEAEPLGDDGEEIKEYSEDNPREDR